MIAPLVDSQRFALVGNVLRPALRELLMASAAAAGERAAFVQAAAFVDWLISRAEDSSVVFEKLDEQVAARILDQPVPDMSEADRAERSMLESPRPPMPTGFRQSHELPVTRAALDEAEQILRWSGCTALLAAADRIAEFRVCLPVR
ncbi:hypothetical protein [Mycobacterium hubeiense]|uniref:hypothetical protein n=1 Tax=Mycobacterium hubeiense TaxID=1867256 RepID=UPI00130434DB|nr:hypothetical protein [Mycobacterium sp. QGD 101]